MRAIVNFLDSTSFGTLLVGVVALITLETTNTHGSWTHVLPILAMVGYWAAFHKEE
jgi:hypothetical protein